MCADAGQFSVIDPFCILTSYVEDTETLKLLSQLTQLGCAAGKLTEILYQSGLRTFWELYQRTHRNRHIVILVTLHKHPGELYFSSIFMVGTPSDSSVARGGYAAIWGPLAIGEVHPKA